MSGEFDPKKALSDQLTSLADVMQSIIREERVCEEMMAKAEQRLNDISKIKGATTYFLAELRQRLDQLEEDH